MRNWLWLVGIALLALSLRIPGAFWGHIDRAPNVWEPDEFQHEEIAAQHMFFLTDSLYKNRSFAGVWNVRGYGVQLGTISLLAHKLGGVELKPPKVIFIGRFLSIFYSLALVGLIYWLSLYLFHERRIALFAALLFSIFDLNITYSHYAVPESSYVFWIHVSVFTLMLFYHKLSTTLPDIRSQVVQNYGLLLFMPLPLAMSFATKFDFIPLALSGLLLVTLFAQRKISILTAAVVGIWLLVGSICFYLVAHGFTLTIHDLTRSYYTIRQLNENVVPEDNHLLHNPILYVMAVLAGSSLPVFALAMVVLFLVAKKRKQLPFFQSHTAASLLIFIVFLGLESLVRWRIDTPFVRRAVEYLPFVAVLAGYGLHYFSYSKTGIWKYALPSFVGFYTLGVALVSQSNFWDDNRFKAQQFVEEQFPNQPVRYSPYAPTHKSNMAPESDILVIHEAYYGRYWKSFTTPFKVPRCCEEVYHCSDDCSFYQQLLSGDTEYQLLKVYPTLEIFPERLLYKHLFGTYESFLGDVRIYRK